uniref:Uncharacterized protein n=1 Tax=Talaromyces marneffei PM1 TaxID=1077442 RepID=A0A093UTR3_TALMA
MYLSIARRSPLVYCSVHTPEEEKEERKSLGAASELSCQARLGLPWEVLAELSPVKKKNICTEYLPTLIT